MTTALSETDRSRVPAPAAAGRAPPSAPRPWRRRLLHWTAFAAALVLGSVYAEPIERGLKALVPPPAARGEVLYWVSPMDPAFRSDKPGKDGMGMDLVPVYAGKQKPAAPLTIDPVIREHNYSVATVEKGPLMRTIRTVGTIAYAEPLIGDITLKVDAWLEKLLVDYEGQPVKKGDALVEVYSPSLVASEEEFLASRGNLQQSVRERLLYWDVSAQQIDALARTKKVKKTLTYYSPFSGIVVKKKAFEGKFFPAGKLLYRIADLARVWVNCYVYQDQLHCVYEGQEAALSLTNLPGRKIHGKVVYVYPYLEPKVRAVKVRLEFENPGLVLKPDAFAQVEFEPHQMGVGLRIPREAVLDTGQRQLVYVARPGNFFDPRTVRIGRDLDGDKREVLEGLREGEVVVTSPQFLLDSESGLRTVNRLFEPVAMPKHAMPQKQDMSGHDMPGHGMPSHDMSGDDMQPAHGMPEHGKKASRPMKHDKHSSHGGHRQ